MATMNASPLGAAAAATIMASSSTTTASTSSFLDMIATPLPELPWHARVPGRAPPLPPIRKGSRSQRPPTAAAARPRVSVDEMTKRQLQLHLIKEKYWRDVQNGRRERLAPKKKREKPKPVRLVDWTQSDQKVLANAKHAIVNDYARCPCVQCAMLRREGQPAIEYRCSMRTCTNLRFTDFVEYFEHQVRAHGKIRPQCRRVRMELFGQSRGVVPFPPVTVYAGQQLLHPAYRPTEWTLDRVELEKQTLRGLLFGKKQRHTVVGALHVWDSFIMAYHQVCGGGLAQLRAQYEMALEFYQSALVHPVETRTFQDGADVVGQGRNWLAMSPELERAEYVTPFRYELEKKDNPFRGFNSDSEQDNSDDDDEANETHLLFESGEPVVFNASVVAAIAEKRRVFFTQAHGKHRTRPHDDAGRCSLCHREGHGSNTCPEREDGGEAAKPPKRTRKYRCSICKQGGHRRNTCPEFMKKLLEEQQKQPHQRCSKCGLLGHSKTNCLQPSDAPLDPRIS
ncbi:hypothetical protein Gpo141_00005428 [Globisporangium polare]